MGIAGTRTEGRAETPGFAAARTAGAVTAPGVPPAYNRAGTRYEVWVWRLPDAPRK